MSSSALPLIEAKGDERSRGVGVLTVRKGEKKSRLPFAGVEISARVADRVSEVKSVQRFHNPFSEHLEAVYTFPLPGGAAVSSFKMRVGNRVIAGKVDERAQARQQYQEAIELGHRAALMEQERDDVFTVQVGNLPPGEEITIEISYSERLSFFENGTTEIRLPLVVAPRYIPGKELPRDQVGLGIEADTDVVPDASRISPPRLAPGFDPKVSLSISVELLPSTKAKTSGLADLSCSQHAVSTVTADGVVKVNLMNESEPLNRDFVLSWRLAEKKLSTGFIYFEDAAAQECYGLLSIIPPAANSSSQRPRDVVFVLDRSGSMQGLKMVSAVRACSILLNALQPEDRLAILAFDNEMVWLTDNNAGKQSWEEAVSGITASDAHKHFVQADEGGIDSANNFLRTIEARGGTEIGVALSHALTDLEGLGKDGDRVQIIVLLTDGQIGQESQVLRELQNRLGERRVFTVGIDTAVNQGFLQHAASMGRGTATFVKPGVQLEAALVSVSREIGEPIVTDLKLEGVGLDVQSIVPGRIPDVFAGRASSCFFKFKYEPKKEPRLIVRGSTVGDGEFSDEVKGQKIELKALPQLWAKQYVVDLEDQFRLPGANQTAVKKEIVSVSIRHSILTRFTAFVVVDEAEVVNAGGSNRTVVQPVEQPAQWGMNEDAIDKIFRQNLGVMPSCPPASSGWGAPALARPRSAPPAGAPMPQSPPAPSESIRRKVSADSLSASTSGPLPPAQASPSAGGATNHMQLPDLPRMVRETFDAVNPWGKSRGNDAKATPGSGGGAWGGAPADDQGRGAGPPEWPQPSSGGDAWGASPAENPGWASVAPAEPQLNAVPVSGKSTIGRDEIIEVLVHLTWSGVEYEADWASVMQSHGIKKAEVDALVGLFHPTVDPQAVDAMVASSLREFARQFRALCVCVSQKNSPDIRAFEAARVQLQSNLKFGTRKAEKMEALLTNEAVQLMRLCLSATPWAELTAAFERVKPIFQDALEQSNALLSKNESGTFWEASI